jgi:hypothetical protein
MLALGAGLLMTFGRPLASEEVPPPHISPAAAQGPNREARAVEIATPVDMGNAPAWAAPQPVPPPAPVPSTEPVVPGAAPVVTNTPIYLPAPNRGATFANKQTGQFGGQTQAQASPPAAPPPAPAKKSEPAIVIPDDR